MKSKFFAYLMVFVLVSAVSAQAVFVFAGAPQKQVAAANHIAPRKKAEVQPKKTLAKNPQTGGARSKAGQNSNDADMKKFESQLQQLVEKGTITQGQADNLTQSLRDITDRMAKVFHRSIESFGPSLLTGKDRH